MPFTSQDSTAPSSPVLNRESLRPDCSNCFALCCTALGFSRTADFALDKPAGTPCQNDSLRPRGFRGCTVFDCFGAGQNVSQNLFQGTSWKASPETAKEMFPAFKIVGNPTLLESWGQRLNHFSTPGMPMRIRVAAQDLGRRLSSVSWTIRFTAALDGDSAAAVRAWRQ